MQTQLISEEERPAEHLIVMPYLTGFFYNNIADLNTFSVVSFPLLIPRFSEKCLGTGLGTVAYVFFKQNLPRFSIVAQVIIASNVVVAIHSGRFRGVLKVSTEPPFGWTKY